MPTKPIALVDLHLVAKLAPDDYKQNDRVKIFVKQSALKLTLDEMRDLATSPRAWGIMGVVVLILGISGPFQTFEYLSLGPRMAYWAIMGSTSFAAGSFFGTWAGQIAAEKKFHPFTKFLVSGLGSGIAVSICVIVLNLLALGDRFNSLQGMLMLSSYCIGISLAIAGLFVVFDGSSSTPVAAKPARILSRIPVEKRGTLISLSVQDHYVEVVTSRGTHLALVRLSDAIAETEGTPGLQIHRSHWVALSAIKSVNRRGGKVIVLTNNDVSLPVSRTYIKPLKEAGILV